VLPEPETACVCTANVDLSFKRSEHFQDHGVPQ
jgi:hypothetical protein